MVYTGILESYKIEDFNGQILIPPVLVKFFKVSHSHPTRRPDRHNIIALIFSTIFEHPL